MGPVKVAILGAGGFVRDAYLGPLRANTDKLLPAAVWSRSSDSAAKLLPDIQAFAPCCKAYHGEDGLAELLRAPDVQAVLVALPPQVQSAVIQAALRAGKHVLSEKPAAPSLVEAEQLLAFHQSLPIPAPLWCVAENYRSMPAFLRMRDVLASGALGTVARLDMAVDLAMAPGNRYYESQWRRDSAGMPGAYLTEGGVHFVAALRMAARAAGFGEALAASAAARGVSPDLPHPDTLTGTLWFEWGAAASFSMTMAAGNMQVALSAAGTRGCAMVSRGGSAAAPGQGRTWRLVQMASGDPQPMQEESSDSGVEAELLCFARLVAAAASDQGGPSLTLTDREAGAAAATGGSYPEADAGSSAAAPGSSEPPAAAVAPLVTEDGHAALQQLPTAEDAYRISAVEAVWDLAVVSALLSSAAAGGTKVQITWPGT